MKGSFFVVEWQSRSRQVRRCATRNAVYHEQQHLAAALLLLLLRLMMMAAQAHHDADNAL